MIYRVTRKPGAPARRAGREWPEGLTVAELTEAEADTIRRDPAGYDLEPAPVRAEPAADPAPKPARKRPAKPA